MNDLWYLKPFVAAYFILQDKDSIYEELKRYAELAGIDKPQELEDKKLQG